MSNATDVRTIEIILTDRFPVEVTSDEWLVQAEATDWDGDYEFQANRTWRVKARAHQDGRWIVYGIHSTAFASERDRRGGEIVDEAAEVPGAIHRVIEHLEFPGYLAEECIGALPAQVLAS